ncbi:hypothetical protein LTR10_010171 [Elasticomyces elasticus]|nr:hypothetical protein LTR10_010171 [Elasticomyces elasticus]KAK4972076.1 hypothetical protein LTR42_006581 [Elasticomyces elasticus]
MTTYAEYQQQTMASNENNDFQLFPYTWTGEQTYLPTTTYDDQGYIYSTASDSYAAQQAYAHPIQDQFTFNTDSFQPSKHHHLQAPGSTYSPANSASHSFDFQNPPMLSSTSDSGASVQSATSSGMNSPHQQSHDWSQQANMNMLPGIVQHDNVAQDLFATTGLDYDTIPVTDKGCVGLAPNTTGSASARKQLDRGPKPNRRCLQVANHACIRKCYLASP